MNDARLGNASGASIVRLSIVCAALFVARRAAASEPEAPAQGSAEPAPYSAWQDSAPHAPPKAIVLRAAPPPELAPPEYARRPVELAPEFTLGLPNCSDESGNDARCAGLGAGVGFGLTALWRVSPYFAIGGTANALGFRFDPPSSTQLRGAGASGLFYGLLGRVYFADHGPVEPYLELGFGGGSDETAARESNDVRYTETATGGAVRVGGAIEFYLGRHARLGPAFDWTRLRVQKLQRCDDAAACVDLDPNTNGHGVGFSTLSLRLTIALGPGL
jgi:hypothetical protein